MDHEVGMGDAFFPWSDFLKHQFTKPLGPSLGVNQMWTKRNDHAPKNKCVDFFIDVEKGSIEKRVKFEHSFVIFYLQLLFPE